MMWKVDLKPAYSLLRINLEPGESVTSEAGAFVSGFGDFEIKTETKGFFKALARALAGGESIFLNTFIARGPAELWFAPSLPGDIEYIEISRDLIVQDTSYLASHGNVNISIAWRGFKGLLAEAS